MLGLTYCHFRWELARLVGLCFFRWPKVSKWPKCSIIQHSYVIHTWLTPYSMLNVDLWTFNYFLYLSFYYARNLGQCKLCQYYLNYPNGLNTLKPVFFYGYVQNSVYSVWPFMETDTLCSLQCSYAVFTKIYLLFQDNLNLWSISYSKYHRKRCFVTEI